MSLIRFNYADVKSISLKKKTIIKELVAEIFSNDGRILEVLNYIFCSDEYLLKINKAFLNHDFLTDVITFDLSFSKTTIGEVYVSVDRVKDNAILHSAAFQTELTRVIFHGALHLCGYRDKKKSEITLMRQKEDYYLQLLEKKL